MKKVFALLIRMLAKILFCFYLPLVSVLAILYFPYNRDPSVGGEPPLIQINAKKFYENVYQPQAATPKPNAYIETEKDSGQAGGIKATLQDFVSTYALQDGKVLEVGSGTGSLQDLVSDYTGLDIAASAAKYYHKPFVVASATAIPFPDNSFDAVWTIWVLEHIPEPERMLNEMRRVLKPDGLLYLLPAWNVPPWASKGYETRPYSDFGLVGKTAKATIPIRKTAFSLSLFPIRLIRKIHYRIFGADTRLRFHALTPNYGNFWGPDADAAVSIDSYEAYLWFQSRGDQCLDAGNIFRIHK